MRKFSSTKSRRDIDSSGRTYSIKYNRSRAASKGTRRPTWLSFEELESLVVSTDLKAKDVARILDVPTTTVRRSAELYSVVYNGQSVNMYDLLRFRSNRG